MGINFNFSNSNLGTVPEGNEHIVALLFLIANPAMYINCPIDGDDQWVVRLTQPDDSLPYGIDYTTNIPEIKWHIDEVFRLNPNAILYVGCTQSAVGTLGNTRDLVEKVMAASDNRVSHFGVHDKDNALITGCINSVNQIGKILTSQNRPSYFTYSPNLMSYTISTLPDLLNNVLYNGNLYVSVDIGLERNAQTLWGAYSTIGTIVGHKSRIGVHQSLAYAAIGNLYGANYDGNVYYEKASVSFSYPYTSIRPSDVQTVSRLGYIFPKKVMSVPGTFFTTPYSLDIGTGDYTRMQRTMVRNKAQTLVHRYVAPELEGDVYFKANGQISPVSVTFFEEKAAIGLQQMLDAGEISAYSVKIPQGQLVLQTGELICNLEVIPVGTAEVLTFNYKYVTAIS